MVYNVEYDFLDRDDKKLMSKKYACFANFRTNFPDDAVKVRYKAEPSPTRKVKPYYIKKWLRLCIDHGLIPLEICTIGKDGTIVIDFRDELSTVKRIYIALCCVRASRDYPYWVEYTVKLVDEGFDFWASMFFTQGYLTQAYGHSFLHYSGGYGNSAFKTNILYPTIFRKKTFREKTQCDIHISTHVRGKTKMWDVSRFLTPSAGENISVQYPWMMLHEDAKTIIDSITVEEAELRAHEVAEKSENVKFTYGIKTVSGGK